MVTRWQGIGGLQSRSYQCGYCSEAVASEKGWHATLDTHGPLIGHIYVCHHCGKPTFFDSNDTQTPSITFGEAVRDIPELTVASLYDEARKTTGTGAYTAAVLACRKLLMHIAVSKGAKPGESFVSYVQFLADQNYIPPDAKGWVDHIRTKSNEANHEIVIMSKDDAEELLSFSEMLLKVIFEFPAAVRRRTAKP